MLHSSAQADSHGGTSLSAFADAQFEWRDKANHSPGFFFNEGAVYLEHKMGIARAFIDVPFFGGTNAPGDAGFTVGTSEAQAFIEFNYDCGLSWMLGQFDTIYGFELNDTIDINFSKPGIVFGGALPTVHTGLLLAYNKDMYGVKFLLSDPRNTSFLNDSTATVPGGNNLEYGLMFSVNPSEMISTSLGYLHHKVGRANTYLIDFLLGFNFERFALNFEFDARRGQIGKTGWGLMNHFIFNATDKLDLGLRFEIARELSTGIDTSGANYRDMQLTVGPQYKVTEHATIKFDYSWLNAQAVENGTKEDTHTITLAGLYRL